MDSTITESTLTDGSKAYAVMFSEGSTVVTIECVSELDAHQLRAALEEHASYATIEEYRP